MLYEIGKHRKHTVDITGKTIKVDDKYFASLNEDIRLANVRTCSAGDCLAIIDDSNGLEVYLIYANRKGAIASKVIQLSIPSDIESIDEHLVSRDLFAVEAMRPSRLLFFNQKNDSRFEIPIEKGFNISNLSIEDGNILAHDRNDHTRTVNLGVVPTPQQQLAA